MMREMKAASDSNLKSGRSPVSEPGPSVQALASAPVADGMPSDAAPMAPSDAAPMSISHAVKPSDSALTADGKTADGKGPKSRQPEGGKQEKIKITLRLNPSIITELKLFCALKKKRLAEVVETAVSDFCSRQSARIMIDDGDLFNSSFESGNHHHQIRRIYERLTGNNWRSSDDQALKRVPPDLPMEQIEMAMLMARLRARTPIRSFAYFVPEILNQDYDAVKTPDHYLRYLWRKFEAVEKVRGQA